MTKRKLWMEYLWKSREALIWFAALAALASMDLSDLSGASSLCPLHNLGFKYCPGCGLGRAIALIFHARFQDAWAMHPVAFFAVPMLLWRSVTLLIKNARIYKVAVN